MQCGHKYNIFPLTLQVGYSILLVVEILKRCFPDESVSEMPYARQV